MNPETILKYLEMLANYNLTVNLTMHLIVVAALASLFLVESQSIKRLVHQGAICILLISVAAHGFIFGNIFHAITFGILAIVALVQLAFPKHSIQLNNQPIPTLIALIFIVIGLWYPEFVNKSAVMMLLFSPVGVIPCPTLITTLGLLILTYPSSGKLQFGLVVFMGLVYGIIGTFVLKVYLDIALLVLAFFALYVYWSAKKSAVFYGGMTR